LKPLGGGHGGFALRDGPGNRPGCHPRGGYRHIRHWGWLRDPDWTIGFDFRARRWLSRREIVKILAWQFRRLLVQRRRFGLLYRHRPRRHEAAIQIHDVGHRRTGFPNGGGRRQFAGREASLVEIFEVGRFVEILGFLRAAR
jgi:hypothetical protein